MKARTKKAPDRGIEAHVAGTPRFLMGQTVFVIGHHRISEEQVTGILLLKDGFHYTTMTYDDISEVEGWWFEPEANLFATKEELIAAL